MKTGILILDDAAAFVGDYDVEIYFNERSKLGIKKIRAGGKAIPKPKISIPSGWDHPAEVAIAVFSALGVRHVLLVPGNFDMDEHLERRIIKACLRYGIWIEARG